GLHISLSQLKQPDVDIYGGHFYPLNIGWMLGDAALTKSQNKVYYVGEYDWTAQRPIDLVPFLHVIEQPNIGVSGDVLWALLPHADSGGFVVHNDGYALHYP